MNSLILIITKIKKSQALFIRRLQTNIYLFSDIKTNIQLALEKGIWSEKRFIEKWVNQHSYDQ